MEEVITALRSKYDGLRLAAVEILGEIGDAQAVEPLIEALQDPSASVREGAVKALGRIGDERAVEPLIEALQDPSASVREGAVKALGRIGDERAVEPLIETLSDQVVRVGHVAAGTFVELGRADLLVTLIQDKGVPIRPKERAFEALTESGQVRELVAALQSEDGQVRGIAAEALGKLGDARAVMPLVTALLYDEGTHVRQAAARALGRVRDTQAVESLIAALAGEDSGVREAAAEALQQIGKPAVGPLIATLQDEKSHLRRAAAETLGKIETTQAVDLFITALSDENVSVRRAAVVVLSRIGDARAEAIDKLVAQLGVPRAYVEGSGAVAEGSGVACGERGVAVGGDVVDAAIITGDSGQKTVHRDASRAFAVAQIKDRDADSPFVVNKEYELLAGVLSRIPGGFVGEPIELPEVDVVEIDVAVHAGGMQVLPHWTQKMRFFRGRDSGLLEFKLIPREPGQKQVLVEFYHQRHWLAMIQFDVEVATVQEPVPA